MSEKYSKFDEINENHAKAQHFCVFGMFYVLMENVYFENMCQIVAMLRKLCYDICQVCIKIYQILA